MDDLELANTYPVQGNSQKELERLTIQGIMLTTLMGGVLPEQEDPTRFSRILDIGCGPGGWVIKVAQTYPHMKLFGIDISTTMINHARESAEKQQLTKEHVEFAVMDALRLLEFPDSYFDLVNFRLGMSFMRIWEWPRLFGEIRRVLKPQGIMRIVETTPGPLSESATLTQLYTLLRCALFRSGHLFYEERNGLVDKLPKMLENAGFASIQARNIDAEYRVGTTTGDAAVQDTVLLFQTFRPYLQRWGCFPSDYDKIFRQATKDLRRPGFVITGSIYTFWGVNHRR